MALDDYELENATDQNEIDKCFDKFRKYILKYPDFSVFRLKSLVEFGLSSDLAERIGYLAFQFERRSPIPNKNNDKKFFRSSTSDEFYADDFEEIEDDDEVAKRKDMNLEGSDEYLNKNKHNNQNYNQNTNKIEDIEDETYNRNKDRTYPKISPEVTQISTKSINNQVTIPQPIEISRYKKLNINNDNIIIDDKTISNNKNTSNLIGKSTSSSLVKESISESRSSSAGLKKRSKNPDWITKKSWRIGEKIGKGSFGEVFQGFNDKVYLIVINHI